MKIVLCEDKSNYPEVQGVGIFSIYKRVGIILRLIRYLHLRVNILSHYKIIWLGDWKRHLTMDTTVVIFDSLLDDTPLLLLGIARVHSVKFCYRNRVHEKIHHSCLNRDPNYIRAKYHCELWSYNKYDCEKYRMNYYNQFHLIPLSYLGKIAQIKQDVFFIGYDKGRISIIKKLALILESKRITYKFLVVPDRAKYGKEERTFLANPIPYKEVLNNILQSRCVVDIVSELNSGLTYRGIEAMVLKKKLITNYQDISKECFYRAENVFIIDCDNYSDLNDFIRSDYKEVEKDIVEMYSFDNFCSLLFQK